jgi:hypothetical protein
MSRRPAPAAPVFSSLADVEAFDWAGVFSLDAAAVRAVHVFSLRSDVLLADRAAALRSMGRRAFGFDDADLSLDLPDAEFVRLANL